MDATTASDNSTNSTSTIDETLVIVNIFLSTIVCIVSILGLFGNILVILICAMSKKLHTVTNIFVLSLSISDLLGCCMLPFQVVAFLTFGTGWILPEWVCELVGALCLLGFKASVVHLALIGISRYFVITRRRTQYLRVYSARNIILMVIFAWLFPLLTIVLPPATGYGRLGYNAQNQLCVIDGTLEQLTLIYIFEEILFSLSFIVIIACYLRIYIYVNRHHKLLMDLYRFREHSLEEAHSRQVEVSTISVSVTPETESTSGSLPRLFVKNPNARASRIPYDLNARRGTRSSMEMQTALSKRELDITKNLFIVVCCFLVFVLPHIICLIFSHCYVYYFKYTATVLVINSCTNPFIYCLKHPTFREVSWCLFRCRIADIPHPAPWLQKLIRKRYGDA